MTMQLEAPEVATVERGGPARRRGRWLPAAYLTGPMTVLVLLVLVPMVILFLISLGMAVSRGQSVWSLEAYVSILTEPLYRKIAVTTIFIATSAMVVQLVIGVPLAYVMAFRAGRFEVPLLLGLVVLDELNPVVRVYAWRMLLGRNGIINKFLELIGVIDQPIDALLFNQGTVIVVLSTGWITYTVIPLYAAMKAIDPALFQAAADLGAGWWTMTRRILLPLAAPGIFVAVLLVYIPLFTDFATPTLVGGTSGYMLGQAVNDLILEQGDLARGAALSNLLLLASGIVAAIAFRLSRINRLD
ncbi:ABC transporter permease [Mycolicibacterium austroafricanum]|nr:ABC transporter permease [Mycolicibacterium austroafricanum]QZT68674.1 ABC transporter permease [Mycolicibacterium austroafricanum]